MQARAPLDLSEPEVENVTGRFECRPRIEGRHGELPQWKSQRFRQEFATRWGTGASLRCGPSDPSPTGLLPPSRCRPPGCTFDTSYLCRVSSHVAHGSLLNNVTATRAP